MRHRHSDFLSRVGPSGGQAGSEFEELEVLRIVAGTIHLIDQWRWPLSDRTRVEIKFFGVSPVTRTELISLHQQLDAVIKGWELDGQTTRQTPHEQHRPSADSTRQDASAASADRTEVKDSV